MRSPIASYPPACAASISVIGSASTTVKWAKERIGMPCPRRGEMAGARPDCLFTQHNRMTGGRRFLNRKSRLERTHSIQA
jgi:hypothetical protein